MSILFVVALPSAAAQITVDGKGDDWVGLSDVVIRTDDIMELTVEEFSPGGGYCNAYTLNWSSGYDLADLMIFYNSSMDTLYMKFNVSGVPGDSDGDYDPDTCTNCNLSYNCSTGTWSDRPKATGDNTGVSSSGQYFVEVSVDADPASDYRITYTDNAVVVRDLSSSTVVTDSFIVAGSIGSGPWSIANLSNVVEMSLYPAHNMTGFGECNDFKIVVATVGTSNDFLGEDTVTNLLINQAPVPVARTDRACFRNNITFDGTSSYDPDGVIVNYTWDFGDGTAGYGATAEHYYEKAKVYTVVLTVTDDDGFVCSSSLLVYPCSQQVPILNTVGVIGLLTVLSILVSRGVKRRSM